MIQNSFYPPLRKIGTITLTGATSGSITLSTTKSVMIIGTIKNDNAGGGNTISLYLNDDTTANHYEYQNITGVNNVVAAARANTAVLWSLNASEGALFSGIIKLGPDSYIRGIYKLTTGTSSPYLAEVSITKIDATATGITKINISGSQNITGTIDVYEVA